MEGKVALSLLHCQLVALVLSRVNRCSFHVLHSNYCTHPSDPSSFASFPSWKGHHLLKAFLNRATNKNRSEDGPCKCHYAVLERGMELGYEGYG